MAFNYNPYNPYQFQNPYMGYQQPTQQYQNQMSQPNLPQTIPGQMVDSVDTARSKDIDMSGAPRYYPNINGQEIYVKQLQPDGTCPTVVYRKVIDPVISPNSQERDLYSEAFNRVFAELDAIKSMIEPVKRSGKSDGGTKV